MMNELVIGKFIKYCIVGFTGMLVDFGVTWLFKERIKANKYFANSLGFILAASSNYLINRFWTFHSTDPHIITQYTIFITVSLAGLGLNNLVLFLIHEKVKLNFWLSKLIAIGIVTFFNFLMNYLITFR
jgi:putative flippase GtrA